MESIIGKLQRSKSPVRIDIDVSWQEIEEAMAKEECAATERHGAQNVHGQKPMDTSCLMYGSRPDTAGSGMARPDTTWQDKDFKINLKEVGEKTEDYFKRVDVFSNARLGSAGHGGTGQVVAGQGKTRR